MMQGDVSFACHVMAGKKTLLKELPTRLRGYTSWLPSNWRIVVLVDRDEEDCKRLKARLEKICLPDISQKAAFRNPDRIRGGTWETLERLLQKAGYYKGGLPKIELAKTITPHMEPACNTSKSFQTFRKALLELVV